MSQQLNSIPDLVKAEARLPVVVLLTPIEAPTQCFAKLARPDIAVENPQGGLGEVFETKALEAPRPVRL